MPPPDYLRKKVEFVMVSLFTSRRLVLPILLGLQAAHSANVLVAYHSLTNYTQQLAAAVAAALGATATA